MGIIKTVVPGFTSAISTLNFTQVVDAISAVQLKQDLTGYDKSMEKMRRAGWALLGLLRMHKHRMMENTSDSPPAPVSI